MLYSKIEEIDRKTQERKATTMSYAITNTLLVMVALVCLYMEDTALASLVLLADLVVFVTYLCMMAITR